MISFEGVSKTYPSQDTSVHNINLQIADEEFVVLVGHSGAGKTTLIRLLLAEEKPTTGVVTFDGINIHRLRASDIPLYRQRIGVVFQDYKIIERKTVYENVAFAMEMIGKDDEEIQEDVPNALDLVGLSSKMNHFPDQLSGGELQRLAIARAIINQPDVLIADEPTDGLDPDNVYAVIQILKKINELGTTVILTTHNKDVVAGLTKKRVVVMEKGNILHTTASPESNAIPKAEAVKKRPELGLRKKDVQTKNRMQDTLHQEETPEKITIKLSDE